MRTSNQCLVILFVRPRLKEEDAPSAFASGIPLGLLTPRCYVSCYSVASLRAGHLFGERKESSPQLRAPPRSGSLDYLVIFELWSFTLICAFVFCAFGVRRSHNPTHRFQYCFCGVAFATTL